MNHKNFFRALTGLFAFAIFNSVLSFYTNLIFFPEILFIAVFAMLTVLCIWFFKREEQVAAKNRNKGFVKVINQNMIIYRRKNSQRKKSLILRVSIIALFSWFK